MYAHARFDDRDLDERSQCVGNGKQSAVYAEQTPEHILQVCPFYEKTRCKGWTHDTSLHATLRGHVDDDLGRTAGFADSTGLKNLMGQQE